MRSKVKRIIEDIDRLFSDTSVSQEKTLEELEEIRAEVQFKIEALQGDIRRKARDA